MRLQGTELKVRFDDRLLTVLNQPSGDRHDIAVRWRQLVDLVARAGSSADTPRVVEALEAIRRDAPSVDEGLRAAAARAVAALPLPLPLLEYFASDSLSVSAPVLAAARLEPAQWKSIMSGADEETARFIETLHPELRSEPLADATEQLAPPANQRPRAPSIHELVERIEHRRRMRAAMHRPRSGPQSDVLPALFRWECGPGGEIAWVEGAPRGALIGLSLAQVQGADKDAAVARAFAMRAPFRDGIFAIPGDGVLAGEWKVSGVPAFEPADGRFAGYRGIALREQSAPSSAPTGLADPDSVRELVHEIKTPLNAIVGFAEIIEAQLLGPADDHYRMRAKDIVHQARLLLMAIDDLDFAAKVHSAASVRDQRVNLGELIEGVAPALRELAKERGVSLDASRALGDTAAATEPELADRLIYRMCAALIGQAEPGERLRLTLDQVASGVMVSMTRPAAFQSLGEDELFGDQSERESAFGLRLARGLARIAGAELSAPPGAVSLLFPRG